MSQLPFIRLLAGSLCITDGGTLAFLHESETLDTQCLVSLASLGMLVRTAAHYLVKPRAYEALMMMPV